MANTDSVAGSFDDGGPAFARPAVDRQNREGFIPGEAGMSLWDYYAAAALAGMAGMKFSIPEGVTLERPQIIAINAGSFADAMIAEKRRREKGTA